MSGLGALTQVRCVVCYRDGGEPFRLVFFGSTPYETDVCPSCARDERATITHIFERIFGTP